MVEIDDPVANSLNDPLVSAIIPYFNRAGTVMRALKSVDRQSYPNIEIVVVDDCSQVSAEQAIAGAELSRSVTVIRLDRNLGPSGARNAGIRVARGRFVAFLDSDDEWGTEKVARQVRAALAAQNPDKVFCTSRTLSIRPDGTKLLSSGWNRTLCSVGEFLFLRGGFFTVNSFLLSRQLALSILFDESLRSYEDYLFILSAVAAGAIILFEDEGLSIYYRGWHEEQLSEQPISLVYGFRFLEAASQKLSEREKMGFLMRMLGPQLAREKPFYFTKTAIPALFRGIVSPRALAGILYRAYARGR